MRLANVCYQDEWLIVVDKPAGMPTQQGRSPENGDDLYTQLSAQYPYVGLHHRLDQPASGLLLFTLSPSINKEISKGFKTHSIEREYLAILQGKWEYPDIRIQWEQDIGKQTACTCLHAVGTGAGTTAARVTLKTGRTHQIRKHAALNGMPVLGDHRYGEYAGRLFPRLALHAFRLHLSHPVTKEPLEVFSDLPEALETGWARADGGPLF